METTTTTTTTTINTIIPMNRKRSRPMQSSLGRSLPILALAFLFAVSSQVTAFNADSSTISRTPGFRDESIELHQDTPLECTATEDDEECPRREVDAWEHEDEDEIDEFDEDEDEEYEVEEDEDEEEEEEDLEHNPLETLDEEEYDDEEEDFYEDEEEEDDEEEDIDEEEDFDEEDEEYLEENFDEGEDDDEEEEEVFDEDEHLHEEEDVEDDDDKEDWTPEEYKEMDILYSRYLQEIAGRYGANWREEYELVVNKEVIYERYLEFEERKEVEEKQKEAEEKDRLKREAAVRRAEEERKLEREAEERRLLIQATHDALVQHEETRYHSQKNRTAERIATESAVAGNAMVTNLLPRRDMVVIKTGIGYYNYNNKNQDSQESEQQECLASKDSIATRHENCQNMVGSQ